MPGRPVYHIWCLAHHILPFVKLTELDSISLFFQLYIREIQHMATAGLGLAHYQIFHVKMGQLVGERSLLTTSPPHIKRP